MDTAWPRMVELKEVSQTVVQTSVTMDLPRTLSILNRRSCTQAAPETLLRLTSVLAGTPAFKAMVEIIETFLAERSEVVRDGSFV